MGNTDLIFVVALLLVLFAIEYLLAVESLRKDRKEDKRQILSRAVTNAENGPQNMVRG